MSIAAVVPNNVTDPRTTLSLAVRIVTVLAPNLFLAIPSSVPWIALGILGPNSVLVISLAEGAFLLVLARRVTL